MPWYWCSVSLSLYVCFPCRSVFRSYCSRGSSFPCMGLRAVRSLAACVSCLLHLRRWPRAQEDESPPFDVTWLRFWFPSRHGLVLVFSLSLSLSRSLSLSVFILALSLFLCLVSFYAGEELSSDVTWLRFGVAWCLCFLFLRLCLCLSLSLSSRSLFVWVSAVILGRGRTCHCRDLVAMFLSAASSLLASSSGGTLACGGDLAPVLVACSAWLGTCVFSFSLCLSPFSFSLSLSLGSLN